MKANHNNWLRVYNGLYTVSNGSKILKWKQITTQPPMDKRGQDCFQWFKDTKMKANHNRNKVLNSMGVTVSNGSKILKWKQITTVQAFGCNGLHCFQWFKDTKMKANHNKRELESYGFETVSNGSKILKWKQITTLRNIWEIYLLLFPMVQRY